MGGSDNELLRLIDPGRHFYDTDGGDDKIPSGTPKEIFEAPHGFARHTLYIYNPNTFDLQLRESDSKSSRKVTLKAKTAYSFEFHAIADVPVYEGDKLVRVDHLGHCEWSGAVWIYHTGGSDASLEAFEVF